MRLNLANGDMVGHTGNLAASITAAECVANGWRGSNLPSHRPGGLLLITADPEMQMKCLCGREKTYCVMRVARHYRTSHTKSSAIYRVRSQKRVHRLLDQPASIASEHHDFELCGIRHRMDIYRDWSSPKETRPPFRGTSVPPMLRHRFRPSDIQ